MTLQDTPKWRVGEIARYGNRTCPRVLILETRGNANGRIRYTGLSSSGVVSGYGDHELMTLAEWIEWWERFRDETTGREWRERADNARREFEPPAWWAEAVENAMEPLT